MTSPKPPPDPRVTPRDVTPAKRLWAAYAPEWAKRLLEAQPVKREQA